MRSTIKVVLVVVFLAASYQQYLPRLTDLITSSAPATVAYLGLFGILSLSLLASAFIANGFLRWSLAIVFTAAAVFNDTYYRATQEFLTYDIFVSLVQGSTFANEAWQQYRGTVLWAFVFAWPLLVGIGLRGDLRPARIAQSSRVQRRLAAVVPIAAPLLALLLLTVIMFARGGDGARGLPVMFAPLGYLNLLGYEHLTESAGSRETVQLPRSGGPVPYDIVLIVDESVSGNYLDINAAGGVPTPLAHPPAGVKVYNYGYAASIANCSAAVNVTLRFGGTRADYVHINARMPSIWQYAKHAGMETVYIDAQRTGRQLINLMTEEELKDIDQWIQFDGVAVRDRDMAAAAKLASLLADSTPQLIWVNKMGAHFPVHDKAPEEFVRYRPALPRGAYADVEDTGLRFGFADDPAGWARYRNSYRNTLLWNVGEFFARIFAVDHFNKAVVVYTSDHGQALHERGNPGQNTHCDPNPVMEEGLVPLVVLHGADLQTIDWQTHFEENRNRASHYNIFPTLLQLMGYKLDAIQPLYGYALSAATNDPFTFNSRFNARLGARPLWTHIDLDQIVTPPASDARSDQ
jgi:lipid A ethanolaminephosphotransferase